MSPTQEKIPQLLFVGDYLPVSFLLRHTMYAVEIGNPTSSQQLITTIGGHTKAKLPMKHGLATLHPN